MAEDKNKRWLLVTSHGVLYIILKQSDRVTSWSEKFTETEIVAVPTDSRSFSVQALLSTENSSWRTRLLTQPITETERCLKTVNWARLALYSLKDRFLSHKNPPLHNDAVVKRVLVNSNVAVLHCLP
jgi:hypothetical protein